jgi:DNA polymerase-3 subunit epsilon
VFSRQELLRRFLLTRKVAPPFRRYLEAGLPGPHQPISEVELLALDLETTGLDAKTEAILSVGYLVIRNRRVRLGESAHHYIQVNRPIPEESVKIHHITDERARSGDHLSSVMPILLDALAGRVLLAHFSAIERRFLNEACKQIYGWPLPVRIIDTLEIEKRRALRRHQSIQDRELRLFNLRERYGLPRYKAHDALMDATATAELFLVQMAQVRGNDSDIPLKNLLA